MASFHHFRLLVEFATWVDAEEKIRGGKDVLNGAKFIIKWGQITI
jgi:hypothetical protein